MSCCFKKIMLSLLSICLIAALCFANVSVTYGSEVVFSGTESSTLSTFSASANDLLVGVSAKIGDGSLFVRIEGITFVRADNNVENLTNTIGTASVRDGRFLDLTLQDNGKIFRVTYGAYASASSTQLLATTVRTMVAFSAVVHDYPWMYAETSTDPTGATADPGSTITYHLFLNNRYDDDSFRVRIPIPANTTVASADFGYSVSDNQIIADITIGEDEIIELTFSLSVNLNAAGRTIDCKANYEPLSLEGMEYFYYTNLEYPVRTVISGSEPEATYEITYNANGGVNPPTDPNNPYYEDDCVTVLGQGQMVKSGKVFLGWSTSATATQAYYKVNDIAAGTAKITMPKESITLYAVWRDITDMPDFVSVSVTWSDMEFTYSGSWDSETHTMDGGWTPNTDGGNRITITNEGSSDVSVALSYTKTNQAITGTFCNEAGGNTAIASLMPLPINRSKEAFLFLSGAPNAIMNSSQLGTVTVTIVGPDW